MKSFKVLLTAFVVGCLSLSSCSNDDTNPNDTVPDNMSGTYMLTEFNTGTATDLDMDGTPNINQKLESDCYNNSRLVFSANNTVIYYMNGIELDPANGTFSCTSDTFTGTWQIYSGSSTLGTINAVFDINGNSTTISLTKEGDEITGYQLFSEYPDVDENGVGFYNSGEITMIFVKN